MIERLTISHLGHRGDGVATTGSEAVFVPYALPGETVKAQAVAGHPDRATLLQVEIPSPDRIEPFCPHFGVCGGCAMQHLQEAVYRAWKTSLVTEALQQAGIETSVATMIDAHGEGRRRATFHARPGRRDVLSVGFAGLRSHSIVPIDHCPVLSPVLDGAVEAAWAIAETLTPVQKPLDIQVTGTQNGLDIDVRGSGALDAKHTAALAKLAAKHRAARITRHGELIVQTAPPVVAMGRATLTLPPGAFLQATQMGEETLARLVTARIGKARYVADLFAGVGPFALRMAEQARVAAIDSDAPALEALAKAAKTPGLKPVTTLTRDLFRRPLTPPELNDHNAVVFDPPRQGAQAQARELAQSKVPLLIAVSCNVNTFARDARILIDGGYRLMDVTPVDQFKYTAHVELVAAFVR